MIRFFKWRLLTSAMVIAAGAGFSQSAFAQTTTELQQELQALKAKVADLEKAIAQAASPAATKPAKPAAEKEYSVKVRGRVFLDYGSGSDDAGLVDYSATEVRAAWLGIDGAGWGTIKYRLWADFSGNNVSLKDAYIRMKAGGFDVTVGQSKVPNSIEWLTAISLQSFMERSSMKDAFGFTRQLGVNLTRTGKHWGVSTGVYKGSAGTSDANEGVTFAARGTVGGDMGNTTWMLGASTRYRETPDRMLSYKARPGSHLAPKLLSISGGNSDWFYGAEAAVVRGPLHVAGEYGLLDAKANDLPNATFSAGYAEVGYILTGETRPLNPAKGTFGRPKVAHPLTEGGMGLWQAVARYDTLDLTDGVWTGGQQDTMTLGVNWYPNRYTRLFFNYSHASITTIDGDNGVNAFGVRTAIDW